MSSIGWPELAIVLVLALIIFGPRKLPELGSSLGKSIKGFQQGLKQDTHEAGAAEATVSEAAEAQPNVAAETATETAPGSSLDPPMQSD